MKKYQKDIKTTLFENMVKLNPDFNLTESEKKWIQNAVNPKHKGYCTPMTKSTCTPRRKALAKRFKKGIDENDSLISHNNYKLKNDKIKKVIDDLLNDHEYEILDVLYHLIVQRKGGSILKNPQKNLQTIQNINEDQSLEYQKKIETIKGKLDFIFNANHYDIIDKIDIIIDKLYTNKNPEKDLTEAQHNDNYFETLSGALDAVRERVEKKGYTLDDDAVFTSFGTGGINYGETKRATIPLLKNDVLQKNRSVTIAIYRMDSGRYELTAYLN